MRGFVRLGVRKLRLTGGEPLLRKGLPDLVRAPRARFDGHRRPGADHQRQPARARTRRRCATRACSASTVSLDALDAGRVRRAVRRPRPRRRRARRHRCGARRRVRTRSSSTASCSAASTKTRCCRSAALRARTRPRAALHRIHGRRHVQWLASRTASCRRPNCATACTRAGRCGRSMRNYRGEVAARYAFADGAGEVGFVSSVTRAVLRRLPPRARVGRRHALHLPVRGGGQADLRARAARRAKTRWWTRCAQAWTRRGDRYSEIRGGAAARRSATSRCT